jgi:hypothetical protein
MAFGSVKWGCRSREAVEAAWSLKLVSNGKNEGYLPEPETQVEPRGLIGLGLLAAVSALAGGLAVTWWHRKTLAKLQNPIISPEIQKAEFANIDIHDKESDEF